MIKLQVIGHLGKDAIVNQVSGKSVINFSVAHTEKFTQNGEKKEKTTWVECAYWTDKTAIAPYLKKGTQVYVEGGAEVRTYESNGKSGASLQCRVLQVQLLSGGEKSANTTATPQAGYGNQPAEQEIDSLPF